MRARGQSLGATSKTLRHPRDPLFLSHHLQTFFNHFIRQGKRPTAFRHTASALSSYRIQVRTYDTYQALLLLLHTLFVPMQTIGVRKGRKVEDVPTPLRRNKRITHSLRTLTNAIRARTDRTLTERIANELVTLTLTPHLSPTLRAQTIALRRT